MEMSSGVMRSTYSYLLSFRVVSDRLPSRSLIRPCCWPGYRLYDKTSSPWSSGKVASYLPTINTDYGNLAVAVFLFLKYCWNSNTPRAKRLKITWADRLIPSAIYRTSRHRFVDPQSHPERILITGNQLTLQIFYVRWSFRFQWCQD